MKGGTFLFYVQGAFAQKLLTHCQNPTNTENYVFSSAHGNSVEKNSKMETDTKATKEFIRMEQKKNFKIFTQNHQTQISIKIY